MSITTAGSVFFSRVETQLVPVRPQEPLWPGPGFEVRELCGSTRRLIGFVPEAAAMETISEFQGRGIEVLFSGDHR